MDLIANHFCSTLNFIHKYHLVAIKANLPSHVFYQKGRSLILVTISIFYIATFKTLKNSCPKNIKKIYSTENFINFRSVQKVVGCQGLSNSYILKYTSVRNQNFLTPFMGHWNASEILWQIRRFSLLVERGLLITRIRYRFHA